MATPTANNHEFAARTRKALRIASVILDCGGDAHDAREMSDLDWNLAAASAHVKLPSPATRELVIKILGVAHAA